ncbi:putative HAD-IA family hydrolase [Blattamonas nauphoetae]|uniref:HAD-IA family hydrolase n=1 Tax=Blattamonas nauphoetae TaxID=2049346 RepID=A0ABQ9XN53_9EUKA|nr:putative HAD-IA family hydrolase [Blattamonas nauphoetae]
MTRKVGFLFDLDGTMINTDPLHFKMWKELLAKEIPDMTSDFYKKNISGGHNAEILARLFPSWTKEQCTIWSDNKESLFREELAKSQIEIVPGLQDFIKMISCNGTWQYTSKNGEIVNIVPLVVTNAPIENSAQMLAAVGSEMKIIQLEDPRSPMRDAPPFVDIFIVPERQCPGKPNPDPYMNVMKENGLDPKDCVAFEDSPDGVKSASSARAKRVFGIKTTHSHEVLTNNGATETVNDWNEIIQRYPTVESFFCDF